jgi:hypothetical protein
VHSGICPSIAVLACLAGTAQAQSVEFGQLRIGMTLDEVQATTPGIEWTYVPSAASDRPAEEIEAPNIISFGGQLFAAKIYHGPDNRHRMTFLREESVTNAAACEAQGKALVADLESKVGAFQWRDKLAAGERLVNVGRGSTAEVSGSSTRSGPGSGKRVAPCRAAGASRDSLRCAPVRNSNAPRFGLRSRKTVGQGPDRVQMDVTVGLQKHSCLLKFAVQRGMS